MENILSDSVRKTHNIKHKTIYRAFRGSHWECSKTQDTGFIGSLCSGGAVDYGEGEDPSEWKKNWERGLTPKSREVRRAASRGQAVGVTEILVP